MRVLAIGACSDIAHNKFTGQSVMFDGIVSELKKQDNKVTVINIASKVSRKTYIRMFEYAIVLAQELWYLLTGKYDLGYITTAQSKRGFIRDYFMIKIFKLFNVKVICHQYGANYRQLLSSLKPKGFKRLVKMLEWVSSIIVEGRYMKEQYSFLDDYENKVRIVPNGLPYVGPNALKPKEYDSNTSFKLYYLSNLIWSKGYFDVLQAVNLLINKYNKNIECVFAGTFMSSPDDKRTGISNKEDFDTYVKEHHLEDKIKYYPGMYGDEKDKMFSKSHVFLLPTYYINEGQPVSIIEAMAYGCVPIVTEYRHIPMMVSKENGIFVDSEKPESIAINICKLMEFPDIYKRKSEACIRDYQNKFSFEKFSSQVISCMTEVTNKGR